jgi:hypothetical protein
MTTDPVLFPRVGTFHRSTFPLLHFSTVSRAEAPEVVSREESQKAEDRIEEVIEMNELKNAVEALVKHPLFRAGVESVIELVRRDMKEHTSDEADAALRIAVMLDYLIRVEKLVDLVEGSKIPVVREA